MKNHCIKVDDWLCGTAVQFSCNKSEFSHLFRDFWYQICTAGFMYTLSLSKLVKLNWKFTLISRIIHCSFTQSFIHLHAVIFHFHTVIFHRQFLREYYSDEDCSITRNYLIHDVWGPTIQWDTKNRNKNFPYKFLRRFARMVCIPSSSATAVD